MKHSMSSLSEAQQEPAQSAPSPMSLAGMDSSRSWYVLILLTITFGVAYIDRQLINLIVEPIKHDLGISDTQISVIQGAAFISAYLLATPIVGRLVDITNRRNILIAGICIWCGCTVLSGLVHSYAELFVARFGVGASEACVLPAGWSIISDYFSTERRARALSVFMVGPQVGGGLSLIAGGLVIGFAANLRELFTPLSGFATWQLAFVFVGLPGVLIAILLLTVREPARSLSSARASTVADRHFSLGEAARFLITLRGFYGRLYVGIGMFGIVYLGLPVWFPSFLIRYHRMAPATVGYLLGIVFLSSSAAGVLLAPWFARVLERNGRQGAPLHATGIAAVGMCVCCVLIPLVPGPFSALASCAGAIFFCSVPVGILPAVLQTGTPSRLRGIVASLYTVFGNGVGLGVGPTAIALVTDHVFHDPVKVGYSIAIICGVASVAAAWMMFSARKPYRRLLDDER
ncbi:MFS transporter [Paraburkholderia sp.]|uniref:MFS transporter n=1 Tax=Paraburkholderia sp. TaxID=1926495 RepID=UPI0039E65F80